MNTPTLLPATDTLHRTAFPNLPTDGIEGQTDPLPLRVLIADDDVGVRAALRACLEHAGMVVITAANGREAVEQYALHRDKIDVVLCDVQMPYLDGPQALERLRTMNPALKACLMTADPTPECRRRQVEVGAAALFRKPFNGLKVAADLRRIAGVAAFSEDR